MIVAFTVALLVGAVIVGFRTGEPTYRQRTLRSWLAQCQNTPLDESQRLEEAQAAVRAMGAVKVAPLLLEMAKASDGTVRSWVIAKAGDRDLPYLRDLRRAEDIQQLAIAGFEALGTEAAPAVGELSRLLDDREHAFTAVRCLSGIGKPAENALLRALTNKSEQVRHWTVTALSSVTDDVELYLVRLKDGLNDSSTAVQFATVQAIGNQTNAPDAAIPLLVTALQSPSDHVFSAAAVSLSAFGTNAAGVFPALSNAFENSNPVRAGAAAKALTAISPEDALRIFLRNVTAPEPYRRRAATRWLGSYKKATPEMLSALERAVADPDGQVAQNANRSLAKLRKGNETRIETKVE